MAARRRGLAGVYRIGYPGVKPSGVWIGHGQRDRANVPGHLTGYARARDMGAAAQAASLAGAWRAGSTGWPTGSSIKRKRERRWRLSSPLPESGGDETQWGQRRGREKAARQSSWSGRWRGTPGFWIRRGDAQRFCGAGTGVRGIRGPTAARKSQGRRRSPKAGPGENPERARSKGM